MRVALLIVIIFFTFKTDANTNQRLTFSECRFSIEIGEDWRQSSIPTLNNKCELEVQNPSINGTLTVRLAYEEFLKVALENGFDYFNNSWVALGRQGTYDKASKIKFTHWEGLKGTMAVGCHKEDGYVGVCPHQTIVLRESEIIDGTILVVQGRADNESSIEEIYKTLAPVYW